MKKRIAFRKLGRTSSHKWAMLRNMVTSLIEHERIVTTVAKAKEMQRLAEKIITMVKRNTPALQMMTTNTTTNNNNTQQPLQLQPQQLTSTTNNFKPHFNAFRALNRIVRTPQATAKAVEVLGPRYQFRQGGYTRVLKLSQRRKGDNAPLALIEYVDRPGEVRAARPATMFQENATDVLWMLSDLDDEIMDQDDNDDDDNKSTNEENGGAEVIEKPKDGMDTSK